MVTMQWLVERVGFDNRIMMQRLDDDGVGIDVETSLDRPGSSTTVVTMDIAWAGDRALLSWRDDRSSLFGPMEVWATVVDCDWILRSTDPARLPSAPDVRVVI